MMGHFSVEMTNFDEENPDDIEWRKAAWVKAAGSQKLDA